MPLHIVRGDGGQTEQRTSAAIFEGGEVHSKALTGAASEHLTASIVHFAAGARTRMHRHTSEQVLYILNGTGKVGDAEADHLVGPGDCVTIPANADHWHGAGDTGSPMSHITIMRAGSETTVL
jgi:quercetin dioxygenase-like cupin family protein